MDVQSLSAIKKAKAALEAKVEALGSSVGAKFDTLYRDLREAFNTVGERLTIIRDDVGTVGNKVKRVVPALGGKLDTLGTVVANMKSTTDLIYDATKDRNIKIVKVTEATTTGLDVKGSGEFYVLGTERYSTSAIQLIIDGVTYVNAHIGGSNVSHGCTVVCGRKNLLGIFNTNITYGGGNGFMYLGILTPFGLSHFTTYQYFLQSVNLDIASLPVTSNGLIVRDKPLRFTKSLKVTSASEGSDYWIAYSLDE